MFCYFNIYTLVIYIPEIHCEIPEEFDHTSMTYTSLRVDSQTHYKCRDAYRYVGGTNVSTCNETGYWSPISIQCEGGSALSFSCITCTIVT